MRYLFWTAGIVSFVAFLSVIAEGNGEDLQRAPASAFPAALLADSSLEVGFSLDGEPEPRLLAVARDGAIQVYELSQPATQPDAEPAGRPMGVEAYGKRLQQAVDTNRFFTARQPAPKRGCKDRYTLRIKVGKKQRERHGCSNQSNDPFAQLAQVAYRDAYLAWRKK